MGYANLVSLVQEIASLATQADSCTIDTFCTAFFALAALLVATFIVTLWTSLSTHTFSCVFYQVHFLIDTTITKRLINRPTSSTGCFTRQTWLHTVQGLGNLVFQILIFIRSIFKTETSGGPQARLRWIDKVLKREEVDTALKLEDEVVLAKLLVGFDVSCDVVHDF